MSITFSDNIQPKDFPFELILDYLPIGACILDRELRIVYANHKLAKISGHSKKDFYGKQAHEFCPDRADDINSMCHNVFQNNQPILNTEWEGKPFNHRKRTFWWNLCWIPLSSESKGTQYVLCTVEDITQLKNVQIDLDEQNESLEVEVQHRTRALNEQKQKLKKASQMLSQHEQDIRRRLAENIHGGLQQILIGANIKANRILKRSKEEHVRQMVQDLTENLEQAVQEARKISVELSPPLLSHSTFTKAIEWLANWVEDNYGIIVKCNLCPESNQIREKQKYYLFEAIREALLNVQKHAETSTAYVLINELATNRLLVRIDDYGKGCDPEKLKESEQTADHFGLQSLKQRLELMGCQVKFDTKPGKGFHIKIYSPMTESQESMGGDEFSTEDVFEEKEEESQMFASTTKRIIVVDDHDMVREGIVTLLEEEEDFQIAGEAANGYDALQFVRNFQPDIVVMDVNMPGMDGIETTRLILNEFPKTKIIGLSVNNDLATRNAMFEAGATHYMPKEKSSEQLCAVIREM